MAQTIKIGVEFFDAQESAKALLNQLKKEAGRFKAGTTISDALVGDIKSLEGIIKKLDGSLAKGFNSHSDVNKVVDDFNQITRIYEHVASTIEKTKFRDLDLNFGDFSHLAKDLSQATAELTKFKNQKEQIEQTTVQDLLGKNSKNLSLFSTDQLSTSSTTVWSKLTQDLEKYKNSLSDAEQKTKALLNTFNAAEAATKTGNQVYKRDEDILSLIGDSSKNQADMKTIRGSFIQDIQASLKLDDNKMNLSKAFSANQKKTLEEWLTPLGLSADNVQNIIATGKSRAEALNEELANLAYKDIPKVRKVAKDSLAQRTLDDEAAKARREYESSEKKRATKEQTVIETEARIKALKAPLQQKDYLSTGSNATLDQKINNLLSRVQALETQLRQKASSGLNAGANGGGNIPSVSGEPYHNALNQRAETEYLERQGRAMIQRWIGTRAIVNKVRNGIRQAYRDIKSLDAAMTNIAVVTDMSIGDLWGKIDSYMSIAKQYGVTTQGVYEVSQLYYQQGLSTSEVMAATSETLKMARIAGMDYAEAADAMTVAIRAFKMEMSDAQTVTDVYSKVAAITASDSEELAIAMSKTASSAASVGSSFENTTAMLAVMVETTRESAQNLGSALKSIISRYGEMKTGVTVDADGEAIDYNKVDTALQSIGIALKDAQGQFRDFDDVIFELSEKWDALDKNTQRYIATIMAGNRQQSRFIALVDNWERLDEVATAAQDSEDAGLLQYAKTLDSLETKLNNIKTSFQEFYMSIINGPVIGKVFETINSLFEGFNKQGSFAAILDVGSIVSSLTIIGNMFVSIFSGAFGQISANWKAMLLGLPTDAAIAGQKAGDQYRNGATKPKGVGKLGTGLATAASFAGLALTTIGAATTEKQHDNVGAGISAVGNALSYGSMGFMLSGGNPIVTIVAGALGGITSAIASWRSDFELEQAKLQDLQKQAEEKNIERAEAKNEYSNLKALLDSYQKAEKNKNISEETYQQWLDINNQITEAYPALLDYIDAEGNAIADVTSATEMLDAAFQKMTTTTWDYYQAKKAEVQQEIVTNQSKEYDIGWGWSHKDAFNSGYSKEAYANARGELYRKYVAPKSEVSLQAIVDKYNDWINTNFVVAGNDIEYSQLLQTSPEIQALATAGLIYPQGDGYRLEDIGEQLSVNELSQLLGDQIFEGMSSKQVVDTFGADYIQQALIDYNNSVYDKTIWPKLSEETKGAITLFADLGVFQGEAGEIFSLDETIKNYINQAKLLQELDSLASEAHLSLITGLLGENNKNVKDIDGYAKLVLSYVELVGGFTGDEINSTNLRNTDEQGKTILDKANDAFNEVQQSLASQPALLDIFNSFYGNLGNLSFEEVNFQLESFGIQDNEEEKDLYDIYTQRWYALQYRNFARWIASLTKQKITPYETWLESQQKEGEEAIKDSEAMRAKYAKEILGQLETSESDSWLFDLITNNTTTTIDSLTSLSNSLNKTIEESSEGSITRNTATQQKKLLDRVKDSTKIQEAFKDLPNPQEIEEEFYSLFLTDFGTSEWGEKLQAFAQKYEVDLAELLEFDTDTGESLDSYIFENFDIQVKAASESIDTIRKTWNDLAEKQKKGFTQKEADNLVQQLNKASGNTDKAFEDYFNISNEGIITLSDFNDALTTLVSDDTQKIITLRDSANAELAKIKTNGSTNIIKTSKNAVENETNLKNLGLTDAELIQTLSNQMITEDIETDFNVTEEVENYVNQLNNFNKILENYKAFIAAETTKQSTINSFYGGEAERKKLSAQKSLASGGQGLSGDTIYDILDAYGISHDQRAQHFTKNTDGTFDIITNSGLFNQLDQATKNAIIDKVAANVDSAEQGLLKLGESAATGKKLDASEIRNLLGAEFDGLNDAQATLLYGRFKGYANGKITKNQLIDDIAIRLQDQAKSKGQTLSDEEAQKQAENYFNEIDAQLTKAIKENFSKRLDIQAKILQGTATETEKEALKEAGIDISGLESKTNKAIIEWINSYINNTDISFDNKVKYAKTAFSTALTNEFGEDIGTLGETAVKGVFGTQDAASDFISKYYTILGQTIDENTADSLVSSWFTRDDSGQYRLKKTIQSLRDELSKIQGSANQEEIDNLEAQLTYYENLQELQRKESLTSSFSSMATAEEIRASELMKLYEDQGKTLGPQAAEILSDQLNALDPLKRFEELTKIFGGLGEIDTETYTKAINATKTSIQATSNSIKSAAENLGSKIITGNDELSDYISVFGEETPEFLLNYYSDAIKSVLKGEDRYGLFETQIKQAIGRTHPGMTEEEIQKAYDALLNSADDASYKSVDTVFNAKIEALESGHLSAANREILKAAKEDSFIAEEFGKKVGETADDYAARIFELKAQAYDDYFAAGRITKIEHLEGIAQSASTYFSSLGKAIESSTKAYLTEAAEGIASGDRTYSTNELGKLYAAARERTKTETSSGITEKEFAAKYIKSWNEAGEAILNIDNLKTDGIITTRQVAEFSNNLVNNVFSAAEDAINKMASGLGTDIEVHEIQAIFDELGMSLDEERAKKIIDGGLDTLLNSLQLELMMAGADSGDISEKIKELQIMIIDMITEALASGFSALGEGIEGTLSEASYHELQKMYGLGNSSMRTSKGVQLNQSDQQALIRGLYGKAAASGRTAGFGEELWKTLSESEDSSFKGYKDIQKEIEAITKEMGEAEASTDGYVQALEAAKQAAMEAADAAEFAFMEQDGYSGKADTFDKFTENVTKAKEALAAFKKGGKVTHADLTAMFDVIKSGSEESIAKFETSLSKAGGNMEEILHSMLNFVDTTGKIDLSKWATKMGIDIETATSAMSEGMSDALMTTAKDQIKYLSGLEAMLKAMVALEEIGNIDLSLSFIGDDGQVINLQLSEILETWDKLSQTEQIELQTVIEQKFVGPNGIDYTAGAKNLTEALGFKGSLSTLLFGKEGIDGKQDLAIADAFGTFAENIRNMSEGEIETVALKMRAAMKDFMIFDDEGNVTAWKEGYEGAFQKFLSSFDFTNIAESLNSKLSEALATKGGKITIPFKEGDLVIESAGADGLKITGPGGKMLTELSETQITAVKESLAKQLGMAVEDIEIDTKTGLVNFYGETAKAETEAIKTEFQSLEEAAAGVAEQTNFLQQTISTFEVSEGFREFVGLLNQITGGTQVAAETVEGAAQLANLGKEINAEGEGNGLQLKVDISEAIAAFEKLQTQFETLVQVLSAPITIDIKSVGTITAGAPVVESQSGNTQGEGAGAGVNTITTHTVQILWEVPQPDFDSIEEPTIGFQWKKPGPTVPAPAKTPTISFYWATNSTPPKYTGKPVEIPTVLKPPTSGGTSGGNGGTEQVIKEWTGTINNISGTAFADGSIGRLYSGAQFANKTLVGELGPELAVYNGEYHLLGQSGAEFVRLPNNAIVFNHKQTEGIVNGQANIRGKAMADGNVSGPALAGGSAAAALEAVRRAKSLWQGLLDDLTAAQLAGGSSGGGGGNTLKGIKEELQEWYNLSRKIADIEQEINNILAERENIPREDGNAYLRSLREQQKLLQEQAATQEILLNYQKLQLERQAENINNNAIWSQFLTVDSNGLLQYTKGNELFGGKGALEVLSNLNEMSGAEQLEFLESLGYTAYDQDGKALEGTELIKKFFEELQYQIDEYDSLYDTIHSTSEELQKLQTEINKINDEITQNQMDLEEDIYNILVDAWEEEIEALEEQKELIEEANDAYVKGLNEALSAEREMYSEEQSIANREQLQRQLSLLRRSGGSASEIANLEKQLDSMLQEEYFRNQEKMIQSIEDANKEQVQQLEHQIRLQEEALEFEKEHGILWTKVYEIMAGSKDEILAFMQNNYPGFFSQSVLEQRKMLTDWAHEIGIYTENRTFEEHKTYAQSNIWNTGAIWAQGNMGGYQSMFNALTPEQQAAAREQFNTTYASARLAGDDHETAMRKANASLTKYLTASKEQQEAEKNKEPNTDKVTNPGPSTPPASTPTYNTVSISVSANPSAGGSPTVSKTKANAGDTITVSPKPKEGYAFSHITVGNSRKSGTTFQVTGQISSVKVVVYYTETSKAEEETKTGDAGTSSLTDKGISKDVSTKAFSSGGLVDYTGPAIVHGSPSKPEAFLNAKQTAMISEAVKFAGDGGALDGIKATLNALNASIKSIVNNNRNEISSFTVAPGAVTIQVAELSDSYDVEELSRDVMNRMVAIASKSTNRGVNRR